MLTHDKFSIQTNSPFSIINSQLNKVVQKETIIGIITGVGTSAGFTMASKNKAGLPTYVFSGIVGGIIGNIAGRIITAITHGNQAKQN